jgi:hypothetical protein
MISLRKIQLLFAETLQSRGQKESEDLFSYLQSTSSERKQEALALYDSTYRRSLFAGLSGRYPIVQRVVGEKCFEYLVEKFIQRNPSLNQNIYNYGKEFNPFLRDLVHNDASLKALPYLPDLALLESIFFETARLTPPKPFPLDKFAILSEKKQKRVRLVLSPSIATYSSHYPIVTIWKENRRDEPGEVSLEIGKECAVITSEEIGTSVTPLKPYSSAWRLIKHLKKSPSLHKLANVKPPIEELSSLIPSFIQNSWIVDFY